MDLSFDIRSGIKSYEIHRTFSSYLVGEIWRSPWCLISSRLLKTASPNYRIERMPGKQPQTFLPNRTRNRPLGQSIWGRVAHDISKKDHNHQPQNNQEFQDGKGIEFRTGNRWEALLRLPWQPYPGARWIPATANISPQTGHGKSARKGPSNPSNSPSPSGAFSRIRKLPFSPCIRSKAHQELYSKSPPEPSESRSRSPLSESSPSSSSASPPSFGRKL